LRLIEVSLVKNWLYSLSSAALDQVISADLGTYSGHISTGAWDSLARVMPSLIGLGPAPVSGHVFRMKRKSGDRWMAK